MEPVSQSEVLNKGDVMAAGASIKGEGMKGTAAFLASQADRSLG